MSNNLSTWKMSGSAAPPLHIHRARTPDLTKSTFQSRGAYLGTRHPNQGDDHVAPRSD